MSTITEINKLIDSHPGVFIECENKECMICKKIDKLRKEIDDKPKFDMAKYPLKKYFTLRYEKKMTFEEIRKKLKVAKGTVMAYEKRNKAALEAMKAEKESQLKESATG